MAGKIRHWKERNGRYSARVVVPKRLRPYLDGRTELEIPIGGDLRTARKKHATAVAAIQHQIAVAEERWRADQNPTAKPRPSYTLPPDQLAAIHYNSQLEFDQELRENYPSYAREDPDTDLGRELRDGFTGQLSDDQLSELVGRQIERFRFAGQTDVAQGTREWRELAMKLCLAEYEFLSRRYERNEGDYSGQPKHPALKDAETVTIDDGPRTTFNDIIDAEMKRRARGRDAKALPPSTIKKYRNHAREFTDFRKSELAATVTVAEADKWMEALQNSGENSNRTVKSKIQNIRTLLNWGRNHDKENFLPNGNPLSGMSLPDYSAPPSYLRTYTLDEAKMILAAARTETKAIFRWIPWLCAYSGMRVSEAGALRKEDFFEVEDRWFWRVTTVGRRTLKTESSERRIPVHKALKDEGLLDFVESAASGMLFQGVTKEKINVQARLSEWVRELISVEDRPELAPNHGWRHLFEDLCRRDHVPEDAIRYMTGRTDGGSQDAYGRSDVMLPGLAKAMDKVTPIKVD